MKSTNFTLREGRIEDAHDCASIFYQALKILNDQHSLPTELGSVEATIESFSSMFKRQNVYSVVAELDGHIVGSNFLQCNGAIAGVGPLSVSPMTQGRSIGKHLMQYVLDYAWEQKFAGVRLVQAAYNSTSLSLYAKLGFHVREPLTVLKGTTLQLEVEAGYIVRTGTLADIDICNKLCFQVHGHVRHVELLNAIEQQTLTVVEYNNNITGYTTGLSFDGHAVAYSDRDLKALLSAATAISGAGFLLPIRNTELFRWCLEKGLQVVRPMTLMSMGLYNEPVGAFLPSIFY
ncbi:GNAT family N-acetyltransferase [Scytonema sp. NUACC26]|uniref:GNAT family N-acetyltransferase n=1 Tax=Scytonema sp. NUACC26 TaxID=3140176 RepID=UPI0034DC1B94